MRFKVEGVGKKGRHKVQFSRTSDSGTISLTEVIGEFGSAEEASEQALRLAEDLKRPRPAIPTQTEDPSGTPDREDEGQD